MPICALVVRAPGRWVLKQRTRTSWDYDPEIRDAMKCLQQQAQERQQASHESRYTCTTRGGGVGSRSPLSPLSPMQSPPALLPLRRKEGNRCTGDWEGKTQGRFNRRVGESWVGVVGGRCTVVALPPEQKRQGTLTSLNAASAVRGTTDRQADYQEMPPAGGT